MHILYGFFSLFTGFTPYIFFRGIHLKNLHINPLFNSEYIPSFILYSLSDGLWTMSLTYILLSIWKNIKQNVLLKITCIAPILGVFMEYLQYYNLMKGTFDIIDIFTIIIFYLITINHYYATKKYI